MRHIKKYGIVIIGIFFVSLSYNLFFSPYQFDTGGVSGLAIVLHSLFMISESSFILIANILLLILFLLLFL